jgi:hypothetical protein
MNRSLALMTGAWPMRIDVASSADAAPVASR